MGTTTIKKTKTASKTTTKPETKKTTVTEEDEVVEEEVKVEKKTFTQDSPIPCHSIIEGGVYFTGGKTKMPYQFDCYGDEVDILYSDLALAVRIKSPYIFNPWFIIDDDDFINEFPQLKKFYDENYTVKELQSILKLPVDKMVSEINALPKSAIEPLKGIAASKVANGSIDSITKIKALDEIFGTDLGLLQSALA